MTRIEKNEGVSIHNQAIVETKHIGDGTRVWAFAHILKDARIGKNCNICDHTFIEADVVIGDNVTIKSGVYLWDGLRIEDDVFIGPNATFTNDIRPRSKVYPSEFMKTYICKGASIGANATILCGITIGQWAVIGAGSVVTKDVPDYALVYGVPAKVRGYACECCRDLVFQDSCAECACGKAYEIGTDGVVRTK
jgi:acetyltransferase-like isoleucine patch superfamily enzyme